MQIKDISKSADDPNIMIRDRPQCKAQVIILNQEHLQYRNNRAKHNYLIDSKKKERDPKACLHKAWYEVDGVPMCKFHAGAHALQYVMECSPAG